MKSDGDGREIAIWGGVLLADVLVEHLRQHFEIGGIEHPLAP